MELVNIRCHECVGRDITRVTPKQKRCSKGTRRNKVSGDCVSIYTPRTAYAKKYNKPVTLLGNTSLFQVSFDTPDQFNRYVQITTNTNVECFIQTLFSLRLRDLQSAKQDIERIKPYRNGVLYSEAEKYFQSLFGLLETQIHHSKNGLIQFADTMFSLDLVNNHATIFTVEFQTGFSRWGHYMIAYKFNDQLHYYDPQKKLTSITIHLFNTPDNKLISFGTFRLNNVKTTVMKKNIDPIPFYGGSVGI